MGSYLGSSSSISDRAGVGGTIADRCGQIKTNTTYSANSATYATNNFVQNNFLPLSGGALTGTIVGDLSATGSFYGDGSKLTGIVAGRQ